MLVHAFSRLPNTCSFVPVMAYTEKSDTAPQNQTPQRLWAHIADLLALVVLLAANQDSKQSPESELQAQEQGPMPS